MVCSVKNRFSSALLFFTIMKLTVKWEAKGIDAKIQTCIVHLAVSIYTKTLNKKKDILLPTCKKAKMAASQNSLVLLAILQLVFKVVCRK